MKLHDLVAGMPFLDRLGSPDQVVRGVHFDSRRIEPGFVFVAIRGEKTDGNRYIDQAIAAGAILVVTDSPEAAARYKYSVLVEDARIALAFLANRFFGEPGLMLALVGVTGTNGKTSFTYMLQWALAACGRACGAISTVDARIGATSLAMSHTTPEAPVLCGLLAQMVSAGMDSAVMEVSSHGIALRRADHLDFLVAVFTNLSPEHLDFHKDMKSYGETKKQLFTRLLAASRREHKTAVVNVDDPLGKEIAEAVGAGCLRYAIDFPAADIRALGLKSDTSGLEFEAVGPWGSVHLRTRLVGRHNVYNVLSVLGTVHALGADVAKAAAGLAELAVIPGRLETVPNKLGLGVWVDYCHTPDALEKVLTALREIVSGRLITVFGAGGDRDRGKRPEMARTVARLGDVAVVTSDNPRTEPPLQIIDEILSGFSADYRFTSVLAIPDRALAIQAALGMARPGDGVLIGGKGHEPYQIVGAEVRRFDDREHAATALRALEGASQCT